MGRDALIIVNVCLVIALSTAYAYAKILLRLVFIWSQRPSDTLSSCDDALLTLIGGEVSSRLRVLMLARPRLICRDGEDRKYLNDDFHGVGPRMPSGDNLNGIGVTAPDKTRRDASATHTRPSCITVYNYI